MPTVNRKLLLAAGLKPSVPMTISSLEHFEPLEADQIHGKASGKAAEWENQGEILSLPPGSAGISGKRNFNLLIDGNISQNHDRVRISDCADFSISGSPRLITLPPAKKFFIEIIDCRNFTVGGLNCSAGRNLLFITDSSFFTVKNCRHANAEGAGIIISNGHDFCISRCCFNSSLSAGVMVIGDSHSGEISECTISRSRGIFNHDAAIHLCHTSPAVDPEHIPEHVHEPLPIDAKTRRPHHILIRNCILAHCRAQGIYLEGAVNCLIEDNTLLNNNKEGICFDWGSSYNIFRRNIVALNGERRNISPLEMKIDFISDYPLLADGSSSMKLPGISLDNGCMNLLYDNIVSSNYGGGIKMIRTAFFNTVTGNRILYNAIGTSEFIPYFHGITFLGLSAKKEFVKKDQPLLDFMPSILNTISRNTITESLQAIFYDKSSLNNFVSDNNISVHREKFTGLATFFFRVRAYLKRFLRKLSPFSKV